MAVARGRAHFGADHAVRCVAQLVDVRRLDRLRKAWPAAARLEFVARGKERLTRNDVDVNARLVVIEQFARAGRLGAALLSDAKLLRREARHGFGGFSIFGHARYLLASGSTGQRSQTFRPRSPRVRKKYQLSL